MNNNNSNSSTTPTSNPVSNPVSNPASNPVSVSWPGVIPDHASIMDRVMSMFGSANSTYTSPTPAKTPPVQESLPKIPTPLQQPIQEAYKAYPTLPKGTLEATAMQESSMAYNPVNQNNSIGRYAWVYGLTNDAVADLKNAGIKVNLNTVAGATQAAAAFLALKQQIHDQTGNTTSTLSKPSEIYSRYAPQNKNLDRSKFDSIASYYANEQTGGASSPSTPTE